MGRFEKRFVNSPGHSSRVASRAQQFVQMADPRPRQRLLDVGCGNGAAGIHLAKTLELDVTGVDVDAEQIELATAAGDGLAAVRFLVADATRLPFDDGEFDFVYTNKTTHHIREWQRALAEMARVVTPGGQLLYSDFVAPLGHRLPTRRSLSGFADQHGLESDQRSGSPLRYTGVFRKRNTDQQTRNAAGSAAARSAHVPDRTPEASQADLAIDALRRRRGIDRAALNRSFGRPQRQR